MVSKTAAQEDRMAATDDRTGGRPRSRRTFGAAIVGGVGRRGRVGRSSSCSRCPTISASKIVRQGMYGRSAKSLPTRPRRCATRNTRRVVDGKPRGHRDAVRELLEGSAKPDVTLVEFFDYACPYCKASNPHVDRLVQEDKDLRVVYRELPILGPNSVTAARLSLEASKAGPLRGFPRHLVRRRPAGARNQCGRGARPPASRRARLPIPRSKRSSSAISSWPASSARPGRRCSSSATGCINGAVGYDTLKKAVAAARARRAEAAGSRCRAQPNSVPSRPLNPCATTYHSLRVLAAGRRLGVLHRREAALELGEQALSAPPASTLATKAPPGRRISVAKSSAGLDQAHGAQMVGLRVADRVRGHVRQDKVGRPAKRLLQPVRRVVGP